MKKILLRTLPVIAAVMLAAQANAQIVFLAEAPAAVEGSYSFTYADSWGGDLTTLAPITAPVALYRDATAADTLACQDAANASELAGKVAFLYRGDCEFGAKSLNAQEAGAVAVIIVNNVPGAPVGMGAGAVGSQVTIPVVMISDVDGALLRPYVDGQELEVFIGNKTGLYDYDAGFQKEHVIRSRSFAVPHAFANSGDFYVAVGAFVHNYGLEEQNQITLNATITLDGDELYNETSAAASILPGDSGFIVLDNFEPSNFPAGYYSLTYTISSENEDEFVNDNSYVVNFWINDEGLYSKSRIDPQTSEPLGGGGIRPADDTEYTWCTMFRASNASEMNITAVSFATLTNEDVPLDGEAVLIEVYEWNDPFDENSTEITFNDLIQVGEVFYDYTGDLQSEFVTATFDQPIEVVDGLKYLVCGSIYIDNHFFVVDGAMDYTWTYEGYLSDIFFPTSSGGSWYAAGFGGDNVPAIVTHFSFPVGIADEAEENGMTPYPNPATDFITIPMGYEVEGNVTLNVFDLAGRELMTQSVKGVGTNLRVDASSLENGMHVFRLTFEDGTSTSFRVQVN